jgi:hypothetical protein
VDKGEGEGQRCAFAVQRRCAIKDFGWAVLWQDGIEHTRARDEVTGNFFLEDVR